MRWDVQVILISGISVMNTSTYLESITEGGE